MCPGYAYSTLMGNTKYTATNWTSSDKMLSVDALYQPNIVIVTSLVKYYSYGFELCVLVNMMAELRFYLKCVDFRSGLALRVADWSDDIMLVAFSR